MSLLLPPPSYCSLCFTNGSVPRPWLCPAQPRQTLEASRQDHQTQRCHRVLWEHPQAAQGLILLLIDIAGPEILALGARKGP